MERWKGHGLLLQALGQLTGNPKWTAWIVGGAQRPAETEYLQELHNQAASLNLESRLRFLGQRSDVPQLLTAADIHCQPNQGPEPFGIAFIEALYAGLPLVTTAMGGPLEIVTPACGLLVPPADPSALSAALTLLIDNTLQRQTLSAAGPARAAELCDPARVLRDLHQHLDFSPKVPIMTLP